VRCDDERKTNRPETLRIRVIMVANFRDLKISGELGKHFLPHRHQASRMFASMLEQMGGTSTVMHYQIYIIGECKKK